MGKAHQKSRVGDSDTVVKEKVGDNPPPGDKLPEITLSSESIFYRFFYIFYYCYSFGFLMFV